MNLNRLSCDRAGSETLAVLNEAADAVVNAFDNFGDWHTSGQRPNQYLADLVADAAVLEVLSSAGLSTFSEESGLQLNKSDMQLNNGLLAVVDPLDGSTNASLRLGWFATSLCVIDKQGPWVAVVHDHTTHRRYCAIRGLGAYLNGELMCPPTEMPLDQAVVAVNGVPPGDANWWQFRSMGCCALELCAVADGRFAGYVDFSCSLAVWDYLGALLVCSEVGVAVADAKERALAVIDMRARRSIVAAPEHLLSDLLLIRGKSKQI